MSVIRPNAWRQIECKEDALALLQERGWRWDRDDMVFKHPSGRKPTASERKAGEYLMRTCDFGRTLNK